MEYRIKELAGLAGVSARTLRYYDQIGLLKPLCKSEAGYRVYGEEEVNRLQQILFYKERGLELSEIRNILSEKEFDVLQALTEHLEALQKQQERITRLIATVEKTIASMKGERKMQDQEKFEAFKKQLVMENEAAYGQEIRHAYGDAEVDAANRRMLHMKEEEYAHFCEWDRKIREALEEAVRKGIRPDSETGEEIAGWHREWLQMIWNHYSAEAHRGVAAMYTADERFRKYYDCHVEGCADFLMQAVTYWI
ncbi:MAG TPA: MerR family transcriptional regulator [Lachnospiraceae bacterium]|nr:MerR family transcriptional regulator [Lachnospiraceae bacterium]